MPKDSMELSFQALLILYGHFPFNTVTILTTTSPQRLADTFFSTFAHFRHQNPITNYHYNYFILFSTLQFSTSTPKGCCYFYRYYFLSALIADTAQSTQLQERGLDKVSSGATELVVVPEMQQGVPEAVERHEPRSHEQQLLQGRAVVDALLKWVFLCLSGAVGVRIGVLSDGRQSRRRITTDWT